MLNESSVSETENMKNMQSTLRDRFKKKEDRPSILKKNQEAEIRVDDSESSEDKSKYQVKVNKKTKKGKKVVEQD